MKVPQSILLMDDDRIDALLFRRVLQDLGIPCALIHALNGDEALAYLREENDPVVGLIVTDLHTPGMDGFEFLRCLKADADLQRIPAIVLTGTQERADVTEAFRLGAVGFMVKPHGKEGLTAMVSKILAYWSLSELPDRQTKSDIADHHGPETVSAH